MLPYCRCRLGILVCVCLMAITYHIFAQMELSIEIGTVLCEVYAWLIWFKEKQLNHANFAYVLFMLLLFIVSGVSCFVFYVCECACESGGLLESPWSNGKKYNAYSIIHQSDFLNRLFLFYYTFDCVQYACVFCLFEYSSRHSACVWGWLGWANCSVICFGFLLAPLPFYLPSQSQQFDIFHASHKCTYKYCLRAWKHFLPLAPRIGGSNSLLKFGFQFSSVYSNFPCFCLFSC